MKAARIVDAGASRFVRFVTSVAGLTLVGIIVLAVALRSQRDGFNPLNDQGSQMLCAQATGDALAYCGGRMNAQAMNVTGKLFFRDPGHATHPAGTNNSDPYFVEKVIGGGNDSSLRLTINDDPNEAFDIWGDSCRAGDCGGQGVRRHQFRADGNALHSGAVIAGGGYNGTANPWHFSHGLHARNPDGRWSHFAWNDGRNYVRGDTIHDNDLFAGTVNTRRIDGGQVCIGGGCRANGSPGAGAAPGPAASRAALTVVGGNFGSSRVRMHPAGPGAGWYGVIQADDVHGRLHHPNGQGLQPWMNIPRPLILNPMGGRVGVGNVQPPYNPQATLHVAGNALVEGVLCVGAQCLRESDIAALRRGAEGPNLQEEERKLAQTPKRVHDGRTATHNGLVS
jgi:hypothetical protein